MDHNIRIIPQLTGSRSVEFDPGRNRIFRRQNWIRFNREKGDIDLFTLICLIRIEYVKYYDFVPSLSQKEGGIDFCARGSVRVNGLVLVMYVSASILYQVRDFL